MICFDRDTGDRIATIWGGRYQPRAAWRLRACAAESIGCPIRHGSRGAARKAPWVAAALHLSKGFDRPSLVPRADSAIIHPGGRASPTSNGSNRRPTFNKRRIG